MAGKNISSTRGPTLKEVDRGEFCSQCGDYFPPSQLKILFGKTAPYDLMLDPPWKEIGRYCVATCIEEIKKIGREEDGIVEFRTEAFVPKTIEGERSGTEAK